MRRRRVVEREEAPPPPPPRGRPVPPWLVDNPWATVTTLALLIAGGVLLYLLAIRDDEQRAAPPATATTVVTTVETTSVTTTTPAETTAPAVQLSDSVGADYRDASKALLDAGVLPESYPVESAEPAGVVLAQNPRPGTTVDSGSRVRLNVSLGPDERQALEVPDVTGPLARDAIRRAVEAGFTVRMVDRDAPTSEELGEALTQEPAAGSSAPALTQLTLFVGR